MVRSSIFILAVWAAISGSASAQSGGLDAAQPIGKFLNGALPSETSRPSTGSWTLVNAFPSLTFIDPVQMLPVPFSNRLMVIEKAGRLVVFDDDPAATSKTVLFDIRGRVESQQDSGMLGMAFHPDFGKEGSPNRHFLYVYYRYTPQKSEVNKGYLRLSRFVWDPATTSIALSSEYVMIQQYDRHNWHNGGGMFFGADGFLYLSIGDEGGSNDQFNDAQRRDLGLFSGVLRIDVDQDLSRSHAVRRQPKNPATPPAGWPNTFSQGYTIPNDNPWLSPDGSQLEEFYAIGLRSPHRMTQDSETGRIWLGDIGQNTQEEISNVIKGGNLQWPYREGGVAGPKAKPSPLLGIDQPPLHSYSRSVGTCVIGGYVYRGALHPELQGKYIFGDHGSSRIWSMEEKAGGTLQINTLVTLSRHGPGPKNGMSSFGIDASGEIYILSLAGTDLDGGRIYRLEKSSTGIPEPPKLLSQTTAFTDLATLNPSPGVIPYEVIQPLWSDGAEKKRWIAIPNDGNPNTAAEKINWSESGHWQFPVGTVLIKHFEIPGRRLETRFFLLGEDQKWFGFTYRWNEDGSDADLLPGPPVEETFDVNGQSWTWHFPGRNECSTCHTDAAKSVLGVKTRHLNSDLTYEETGRTANQIVTLNRLGFFSPAVNESSLPNLLTSKNMADESASLERRARSYLDINCSQCHQPAAPTQAAFDARMETPPWFQNLVNVIPNNDFGLTGSKLVTPGDPLLSLVHHRVGSLEEGKRMPPLAKNVIDSAGLQLLADWIASLDPAVAPSGPVTGPAPNDHTPPALTLSMRGGSPVVSGPFVVDLTASESIEGLAITDFVTTQGSVSNLSGSGTNWSFTVLPSSTGLGSITIPADRVTDLNGNANLTLASPLTWDFQLISDPDNRLTNGDFENGLSNWDFGGALTVSTSAKTGAQAIQVGASSYLVQTIPITGSENFIYSGWYFSQGNSDNLQAGLTFWDANGQPIIDRIISLPQINEYGEFVLEFTAPANAASVSVWILTGNGGGVTVDGLTLKPGGNGDTGGNGDLNLLANGDFDDGLAVWDAGNQVSVSPSGNGDTQAAELGGLSFIVQTLASSPGQSLKLSGSYFSEGNSERLEVGFTFWTANGEGIEDRTIVLGGSNLYQDFVVDATAPANTASMTVWVWCGAGGKITVDNLLLTEPDVPSPANLLTNGDFESGTIPPWDAGGPVTLSANARTGSGAIRLSSESFIVHNQSAQAGEDYTFGGFYQTGAGNIFSAGFSFWGPTGEWLGDTLTELTASGSYTGFEILATTPPGTTSFSAWIWCGLGSELTADDLYLLRTQEAPPEAALAPSLSRSDPSGATGGTQTIETLAGFAPRQAAFSPPFDRSLGLPTPEAQIPFSTELAGNFSGLAHQTPTDPSLESILSGHLQKLRLTRSRQFSGKLIIEGRPLSLRGRFAESGNYQASLSQGRSLNLQLIMDGGHEAMTGSFVDEHGSEHQLRAQRAAYSSQNPTDLAGAYTSLFPEAIDGGPIGYALHRIAPAGIVRTTGALGDGRRFSHTGSLDASNTWSLFSTLRRRPSLALLGGELSFDSTANDLRDFGGTLTLTGNPLPTVFEVIGSAFQPARNQRSLSSVTEFNGVATGQLTFPDGGTPQLWPIDWKVNDRLISTGSRRFIGRVNSRTGLFRGRAIEGANGFNARLEGVVFQKQEILGGAFRTSTRESGELIIEAGAP